MDRKIEKTNLVREYAAGHLSWRDLQAHGMESYPEVLGILGELNLSPPLAPMDDTMVSSRRRGIEWMEEILADRS